MLAPRETADAKESGLKHVACSICLAGAVRKRAEVPVPVFACYDALASKVSLVAPDSFTAFVDNYSTCAKVVSDC